MTITAPADLAGGLKQACGDLVHLPGEPGYDAARTPWNLAVDQRPAAVATPTTVEQVSGVVRHAARLGLRVAPQTTGHAAGVLAAHDLTDVVLVRTGALDGVYVDPERRTARVEAGTQWHQVIAAAAPHGLTALHGSAPDIGVVGYTLTGGLSFYARKHGLAVNSVTGVELVTATGEVVRADEHTRPELFWALRGGGGANFGIVTALELRLLPVAEVYAGMLLWDISRADEVVRAWSAWCETAPEEATTSLRILRFPPLPDLPDFLRGRAVVIVDGAVLLDDEPAAEVLAPLRALRPELDMFGRMPAAGVTGIHLDPPEPVPGVGAGTTLARFDGEVVDAFLDAFGPGVETPVFMAEVRQLGGALGRPAEGAGALPWVDAAFAAVFVAMVPEQGLKVPFEAATAAAADGFAPWRAGQGFLNFAERPVDPRASYTEEAWQRLQAVRRQLDPGGIFVAHHRVG